MRDTEEKAEKVNDLANAKIEIDRLNALLRQKMSEIDFLNQNLAASDLRIQQLLKQIDDLNNLLNELKLNYMNLESQH